MIAEPAAGAPFDELQPTKVYPPIGEVENSELHPRDMLSFIKAGINQDGLVGHNLHGYNDLIENGLNGIMTRLFDIDRQVRNERTQTEADRKRKSFQVRFQFHDVKVGRPTCTTYLTGQFTELYPARARLTGLPYSGPVTLGATATVRAYYEDGWVEERTAEIPPFQIGGFPTMVGGVNCHTANCPRTGLKEIGEDPTDPGGYFIAKRNEWVVDLLENIRYNCVHIHQRMMANEHVRAEFLSQPGGAFESSSQIRVRFMTNGHLTVEINSTKFEKVRLPFYLIYRLFGMTDDRTVTETIVFDADDRGPITAHMLDILERAFQLATPQWDKGKGFDSAGPIGPWLVTTDEITNPQALDVWLDVNGDMMQNGNTRDMIFSVAKIVSHVSQYMTLLPGDIICTGTPAGVGMGRKPAPVYLKPGDVMMLGIKGLGEQRQRVVPFRGQGT